MDAAHFQRFFTQAEKILIQQKLKQIIENRGIS